ncbi:hypothetical protein BDD12DRAFT_800731 [Trichophaea hybrida]|nr:hypothetical protein BDD12DRAFT_800731 [Trichophaea hybrida]
MHLHRLTTQNLPSIRIYDQNSMDIASDHHSSSASQRSMPREIPIPKLSSPTSSRGGSFHGSIASPSIPPILSLEPPGPSLPPSNYHTFRHSDSVNSVGGEESGSEGLKPRRVVVGIRERGREQWKLSPIGKPNLIDEDLSGSRDGFSIRSEDSFDRNWREGFYNKVDERASPQELQSAESLFQQSVKLYDKDILKKLNTSSSEPSSFARHRLTPTPPRDIRPFALPSDSVSLPPLPAHLQHGSPRHLSPSTATSPAGTDSPSERWVHVSAGEHVQGHSGMKHEQPLSFSSLTNFRSNGNKNMSSSHVTDNGVPPVLDGRMRRSVSASLLTPGYDPYEDEDSQMEDMPTSHVSRMRQLTLHDARTPPQYQRVGSKRRASSPPNEDRLVGNSEPTKKGLLLESAGQEYSPSRRTCSPIHHHPARSSQNNYPKYYHVPNPRSASGSFASASASSGTTMWSTSVGGYSTASSFTTSDWGSPTSSYNQSPNEESMRDVHFRRVPIGANRPAARQRHASELSSLGQDKDSLATKHSPKPKMGGMFICECCPKKPKKFDNRSDLQLHEMEKQYSCNYCNNRFKNKNEAERHQNSLHLRKHSWSCNSLAGNYEAAFHQSPHRPSFADVCGYCGKEFPVPAQWNARIDHLTAEHKFGECNQSKKFYRADHFRQHLKHSHSGTSGKWTNVLENACMRDEILPTPINRGGSSGGGATPSVISEEVSE